jgi:hypothetical protein
MIVKRLIPCRMCKFAGRETLTPWKPFLKWVETYSIEMGKIRSETKDRDQHLDKMRAVLADLLNIAAEHMWQFEEVLEDIMRDFGIVLDEAVLKEQLQHVRNVVKNDCSIVDAYR